jgi:hypothetical protein
MRWQTHLTKPVVVIGVIVLGLFQINYARRHSAFEMWVGERRFVIGAEMVRNLTGNDAVVLAGAHSGSLRYYAGRMTITYGHLDENQLDPFVDYLNAHGAHPYFLLEPWEVDEVRQRFRKQRAIAVLDVTPMALYVEPGRLYMYDLSSNRPRFAAPEVVTGTTTSLLAARPAPPPQLILK